MRYYSEKEQNRIARSLNPYYTRSYSMRKQSQGNQELRISLNPYYTGSYSMRYAVFSTPNICLKSLNPYYTGSYSMSISRL